MIAVLKFWREGLIVVLLGVAVVAYRQRLNAERERGRAEERTRVQDSVLAMLRPQIGKVDTVFRRDTTRLTKIVASTTTLHDTVLKHLTDTVLVKQALAQDSSTIRACVETVGHCAELNRLKDQEIAALNIKLKAQPATIDAKRWYSDLISIGPYAGIDVHGRGSIGVSGQLSLLRFP